MADDPRVAGRRVAGGARVTGTMSDADSLLWRMSSDPSLRSTVVAVALLDRAPRWDELRARVVQLVELVPRLRSRVAPYPLGFWRPRWVEDTSFDLGHHLVRISLPDPGLRRGVLDLAQTMAGEAFDPSLPLWKAVLVHVVEDQKAALILKFHHAVADGLGALALFLPLLDHERSGVDRRGTRSLPPRPAPQSGHGVPAHGGSPDTAAKDGWGSSPGRRLLAGAARVPHAVLAGTRNVQNQLTAGVSMLGSAVQLLAPAWRPLSPLLVGRGGQRRFEVIDLPPGGLRTAADTTGTTVNDVFVTGTILGLHRYHERHTVPVDRLRALMPVSIRRPTDPAAANRFVPVRFLLPLQSDPRACLHTVREIAGSHKHAPALALSDALAAGLDLMPPGFARILWGSLLKGDDLCVTNIPGPRFAPYLAGARIDRLYAFAPPSGAALNVSLLTLAGRDYVGLNIDRDAVADSPKLATSVEEGLLEAIALGPPGAP